jgi:putative endopeptidase
MNTKNKKSNTKKKKTQKTALNKITIGLKAFEDNFKETHLANKKKNLLLVSKYQPIGTWKISPKDNFYNYINYEWLENIKVDEQQKYIIQVDDFRLTQDKVYRQLHDIIIDYMKNNNNRLATNMKNYYDSVIKMNSKIDSRRSAFEIIAKIDELRLDKNNIWKMLAMVNSSEITAPSCPLSWSLFPDNKQPNIFRCYIDGYGFVLVDQSIYVDDGTDIEYKKMYRGVFLKTMATLFNTVLGEGHGLVPEDVFDVEKELYNVWSCNYKLKEDENNYNKILASEALKDYGFDWAEMTKEMGFKKTPPFFISSSTNYIKCCVALLMKDWDSQKWRSFWCWLYIRQIARVTKDWESIIYDFNGRFQRGQPAINTSNAVSSALYMSLPFNTFLTNSYVAKYEDPYALEYVKILCSDLKTVYKRIVERNKWLSPVTKKQALKKLNYMNFVVGKPENLVDDPDITYGTSIHDNLDKLMAWRCKMFISLEGKHVVDVPIMDWTQYPVKMTGSQAYIVNASYTPAKNSIYINLGYIQKPFVDLEERGIEYNLAHIGYTIGHELSHALDDWGSQYDYNGKLNNWWTESDKRKYKAIQDDVIKQYEEFAKRDGIIFDASIGIGEDLADISGLAICDQYLRDFQQKNNDLLPIRNLSFDAFYTYFAFQQKQKIGKKAIRAQLKTNPHPLDVYRTNVPLSRSQTFRSIYDVKKGDGMWWHNTDIIW